MTAPVNAARPGRLRFALGWATALAGSLALNLCLFALMPGLIRQSPKMPDQQEILNPIQVIRVKRPEPLPPKKKKPDPPKRPRQTQPLVKAQARPSPPRPKMVRPRLPFKLNTRLPAAAMDLPVPEAESFSMDLPVLKSRYTASELDAPLRAVKKLPPLYPVRAKRRHQEGFVTVEFSVTPSGNVENIRIVESDPPGVFDKSVKDCVSRWKFAPGTVEGRPVTTLAKTTIRFQLEQ